MPVVGDTIMVFRRGRLKIGEQWTYNGLTLEVVNIYISLLPP